MMAITRQMVKTSSSRQPPRRRTTMRKTSKAFKAPTSNNSSIVSGSKKATPDLAPDNIHGNSRKARRDREIASKKAPDLIEYAPPPTQCVASLKFFSTPELCEKALLYLQPWDLIKTKRVSRSTYSTILGSIKLQRTLFRQPEYHPVVSQVAEDDVALGCMWIKAATHSPSVRTDSSFRGPPLNPNPWLFCSAVGVYPDQAFCPSILLDDLLHSEVPLAPPLGHMFITQPPLENVRVECCYRPTGERAGRGVWRYWMCTDSGGIKVKDLVEHIRTKLRESAAELETILGGPTTDSISIALMDRYDICENC